MQSFKSNAKFIIKEELEEDHGRDGKIMSSNGIGKVNHPPWMIIGKQRLKIDRDGGGWM